MRIPHVVIATLARPAGQSGRPHDAIVPRSSWEDAGALEAAMAAQGLRRRVGVTVSGTASAIAVVARSDMMALVPRRLALAAAESGRLQLIDPPYQSPVVEVHLVYRRDRLSDPSTAWMRDQLAALAQAL